MEAKKMIRQCLSNDWATALDGKTIDEVISMLEKQKDQPLDNISFKLEYDWDSHYLNLYGDRLETDEEYNRRTILEIDSKKTKIRAAKKALKKAQDRLNELNKS